MNWYRQRQFRAVRYIPHPQEIFGLIALPKAICICKYGDILGATHLVLQAIAHFYSINPIYRRPRSVSRWHDGSIATDGAGTFSFTTVATAGIIGSFTFTGTNIDTDDSSGITVTPPLTANSDLTVQNDLNVVNDVFAKNFISTGTGSPEFDSSSKITFTAPDGVVVNLGALRLANFNNAQRDAYSADNGDMIYNTQDNKIQAYINGAWRRIDDSAIV